MTTPANHYDLFIGWAYHVRVTEAELEVVREKMGDPDLPYEFVAQMKARYSLIKDFQEAALEDSQFVFLDETEFATEALEVANTDADCENCPIDPEDLEGGDKTWLENS